MKSSLVWTAAASLALSVLGAACSDQNAPVDRAHPTGWVAAHGADPGAGGAAGECRSCHGADLAGAGVAVACLDCHLEGPPFTVHPAAWTEPRIDHQPFAETLTWTTCATAGCHGPALRGGRGADATPTGPSCFRTGAQGCHPTPDGRPPGPTPPPLPTPTCTGRRPEGPATPATPKPWTPPPGSSTAETATAGPQTPSTGGSPPTRPSSKTRWATAP